MRVLFVAPYVPSPARLRSFLIIRYLARHGHDISVVALGSNDAERDAEAAKTLSKYCAKVRVVPHSKRTSMMQCALHVTTPVPVWAAACFSPKLEAVLAEVAERDSFDVVHVEHLRAARFARIVKDRLPVVFDAIDCMTDIEESRQEADGKGSAEPGVPWQEHAKLSRYEPKCASEFDRVVISSDYAAAKLTELAEEQNLKFPIEVIASGVDLDYFSPRSLAEPVLGAICLVGDTDNREIRDAVTYFTHEIFPAVRQAYPSAAFTLVGRDYYNDLAKFTADPSQRITVTGPVEDIRPYVAKSPVVVWPIRHANRAPDTVVQTLAMGRALIASPEACRHLAANAPRESLCLADTPLSFVTQILHLLLHPEEAARLGDKGREYAEQNHDWEQIIGRLTAIYSEAIATRSEGTNHRTLNGTLRLEPNP